MSCTELLLLAKRTRMEWETTSTLNSVNLAIQLACILDEWQMGKWRPLNKTKNLLVFASLGKSPDTGKSIVTYLSMSGIFSPLASLSIVLLFPSDKSSKELQVLFSILPLKWVRNNSPDWEFITLCPCWHWSYISMLSHTATKQSLPRSTDSGTLS